MKVNKEIVEFEEKGSNLANFKNFEIEDEFGKKEKLKIEHLKEFSIDVIKQKEQEIKELKNKFEIIRRKIKFSNENADFLNEFEMKNRNYEFNSEDFKLIYYSKTQKKIFKSKIKTFSKSMINIEKNPDEEGKFTLNNDCFNIKEIENNKNCLNLNREFSFAN